MKQNGRDKSMKSFFVSLGMFFITPFLAGFASYLYEGSIEEFLRNVVVSVIGIGSILFAMSQSKNYDEYLWDNKEHYGRYFLVYIVSLVLVCLFPMLPETGWPFLTIAIALALFSNVLIGAFSYGTLLMMAVLLSRSNYQVFFLFFIAGMIGILLFSKLDTDYKTGIPIFVSFTIFVVIETCFIVLFSEEALTLEDFLILGINVFITFLILIILLRYYSFHVIHKYRENYMEINDPECVLLVELKNKSQFDYYQAVHTAYLSAKIARRIGLKCEVAKAGGYYLRIGKLKGENTKENIDLIGEEHHFPPEVMSLLLECNSKPAKIITKEAAIVMYSEAVVTSIMFLFQKDNKAVLDYEQIVDVIFKKKMSDGILSKCQITYEEICIMKKMFGEEKLYYDFLR